MGWDAEGSRAGVAELPCGRRLPSVTIQPTWDLPNPVKLRGVELLDGDGAFSARVPKWSFTFRCRERLRLTYIPRPTSSRVLMSGTRMNFRWHFQRKAKRVQYKIYGTDTKHSTTTHGRLKAKEADASHRLAKKTFPSNFFGRENPPFSKTSIFPAVLDAALSRTVYATVRSPSLLCRV